MPHAFGQWTQRAGVGPHRKAVQKTRLLKAIVPAHSQTFGLAPARQALAAAVAQLPDIVDQVLAEGTFVEIANMRVQARVIRECVKAAKLGLEAQQIVGEAWLRLERRVGEVLIEQISRGRPKKVPSGNHFRLVDLGLTKKAAMRVRANAAIPLRSFENYFRTARVAGWEITWSGSNGLQGRANTDLHEISRQRQSRLAEDQYYMAAGSVSPRARPLPRASKRQPADSYFMRARSKNAFIINHHAVTPGTFDLRLGDCLDLMAGIADQMIDLILSDLPYGQQVVPWDQPLDLSALWREYRRIIRPNCPIILFAGQPFTSHLVMSQPDLFKFDIVWLKNRAANFVHAFNRPLAFHESILVFSEGAISTQTRSRRKMPYYPKQVSIRAVKAHSGYPRSYVEFATETGHHPTQKAVALLSYLIELFSRPGELVLDSCMGSGSTGIAATRAGRNFIGIEKHMRFFEIAQSRFDAEDKRNSARAP